MERIVAGYDGSTAAGAAVAWAAREAELHDATLEVWTILGEKVAPRDPELFEALSERVREAAGLAPVTHHAGRGLPAVELIRAAEGADLLVVGNRGHDALAGLVLGSVSRTCLYAAPCDVAVVGAGPQPSRHGVVMVGVDGSPASRKALRAAASEAALRGATLRAVHAVHRSHLGSEAAERPAADLLDEGRRLLEKELAQAGVTADPVVLRGRPGEVLVRRTTSADLLVLGSRGHNPVSTLLLGSTSDHCAHHARCPVMVVRD